MITPSVFMKVTNNSTIDLIPTKSKHINNCIPIQLLLSSGKLIQFVLPPYLLDQRQSNSDIFTVCLKRMRNLYYS